MTAPIPKFFTRTVKGPCIFCCRVNVRFNEEHLPPESILGDKALVLIDWVCLECNHKLSVEDKYFATHYHGAVGRIVYGIIGKKSRGAEIARKDLWGRFQQKINTVQLQLKARSKEDERRRMDELHQIDTVKKGDIIPIEV